MAKRVRALAKTENTSASRMLVELIAAGLKAREQKELRFLVLIERLEKATDQQEREWLKKELAALSFSE